MKNTNRPLTTAGAGCLLLVTAACGILEPDEAPASLAGDWAASCCRTVLGADAVWELELTEDGLGNVTGTVLKWEAALLPVPRSEVYTGIVHGRHEGQAVVLHFSYDQRHAVTDRSEYDFEGRQISDSTFVGSVDSWSHHTIRFWKGGLPTLRGSS